MQTSLIWIFIFCLIMAGISFVIGFLRPRRPGTYLSKAAFLLWLFLLAPFLAYVLYQQSGAVDRLEQTGFVAHPAIEESVGIANGAGSNPTWLFKVEGEPEAILQYYRSPDTRQGWQLAAETPSLLSFKSGEMWMHILATKGWSDTSLMFKLAEGEPLD